MREPAAGDRDANPWRPMARAGGWPIGGAEAQSGDERRRPARGDRPRAFLDWVLALVAAAAAWPVTSLAQGAEVDADAVTLLRRSTDYLAGLKQFRGSATARDDRHDPAPGLRANDAQRCRVPAVRLDVLSRTMQGSNLVFVVQQP